MTPSATVINRGMAPRGNKGMALLTTYLHTETLRKFKSICALHSIPMTRVVQEAIIKIIKEPKSIEEFVNKIVKTKQD